MKFDFLLLKKTNLFIKQALLPKSPPISLPVHKASTCVHKASTSSEISSVHTSSPFTPRLRSHLVRSHLVRSHLVCSHPPALPWGGCARRLTLSVCLSVLGGQGTMNSQLSGRSMFRWLICPTSATTPSTTSCASRAPSTMRWRCAVAMTRPPIAKWKSGRPCLRVRSRHSR